MRKNLVDKKNAKRFDKWFEKALRNHDSLSVMEKQARKSQANNK